MAVCSTGSGRVLYQSRAVVAAGAGAAASRVELASLSGLDAFRRPNAFRWRGGPTAKIRLRANTQDLPIAATLTANETHAVKACEALMDEPAQEPRFSLPVKTVSPRHLLIGAGSRRRSAR